jgi:diacylglycerol kinase (ATP)
MIPPVASRFRFDTVPQDEALPQASRRNRARTPLRLAVLSNPDSGRNRGGIGVFRSALSRNPRVLRREARTPEEVAESLAEIAAEQPDLLAINGGDGTVQATLTVLLNRRSSDPLPMLALLCGGTTNMSAGDVGVSGSPTRGLCKLLAWAARPTAGTALVRRPVLRIDYCGKRDPLYGMFFGAGAIINGIEYCHRRVHSKRLRDPLAPGICTLRILLAMARGEGSYVAPVPIAVESIPPGTPQIKRSEPQNVLLVLASTLERLFLGIRPYWGTGAGDLYFTAIRAPPPHPLRALPPLFWGRPNRFATPENGYLSRKVTELRLAMAAKFTLDGELYETDARFGPMRVSNGGIVSFVRL